LVDDQGAVLVEASAPAGTLQATALAREAALGVGLLGDQVDEMNDGNGGLSGSDLFTCNGDTLTLTVPAAA
jgi:hypothetical protein